jgi:hypothetical protein
VGQRLKLRHKITGVEKGPFFGWYPADWVKLYVTGEYDYVRSSDVFDKNGREIFAGDLLSIGDNAPFEVVENVEKVGVIFEDGFEELTPEFASICEVVGCEWCLF